MTLKTHLIVIDPQKDFTDPNGSLFVPGADADMQRLASMIDRLRDRITDIHVTLDSHHTVDISHPIWWKDDSGSHPAPFTAITAAEVDSGRWTTTQPGAWERSRDYLRSLEAGGRYPHVIWPYHCLIGDEGHAVHPDLAGAIFRWEERFAVTDFVTKGSNPWTEHFSALAAEVPDPEDASTQINTGLIDTLQQADIIVWAGEALSHCLANSVRDVANQFSDASLVEKMVLLTDATGNVPSFESYGEDFLEEMKSRGMKTSTTTDFLA